MASSSIKALSYFRITNSPIADVFVVWGKTQEDGQIRGFLLEKVYSTVELSTH